MKKINLTKENYKQLIADHKMIDECVAKISQIFEQSSHDLKPKNVKDLFANFKDCVLGHFDREENNGILHDLVEDFPNICCQIKSFSSEHKKLSQDVCQVCDKIQSLNSKQLSSSLKNLKNDFCQFVTKLKDHESRENCLIMDTYNMDMGGEE